MDRKNGNGQWQLNVWISNNIPLKFVPNGHINHIPYNLPKPYEASNIIV